MANNCKHDDGFRNFIERKKVILHLMDSLEDVRDKLLKALDLVEYKLKQEQQGKEKKEPASARESSSVLGHP